MAEPLKKNSLFYAAEDKAADAVLLGCPYEDEAAFRKGAAAAPAAIRTFLSHISSYHPDSGCDLRQWSIVDYGDIATENRGEGEIYKALEETALTVFREKRFLLTLGGSGGISYPLVSAAARAYPRLKVISLDAHTGLEPGGEGIHHDNVFRHLLQDVLAKEDFCQWGARVGSKEAATAGKVRHFYDPPQVKRGILEQMHKLYPYPIYLSLDIDVMDPPYAPGSGHPVYGGIATAELFETIALLQSLRIVGMDIKEIVPPLDQGGITTVLGATVVKEALIHFLPKNENMP